jgi:hypothetical protein
VHAPILPPGKPAIADLGSMDTDDIVTLIRAALGRPLPAPSPRDGRTLHLIESLRPDVHAAVKKLVCIQRAHAALAEPISDWDRAEHASTHITTGLIDVLTRHTCTYAPVAAGIVASWRGLIVTAIDFHDGTASFRDVTDRAEQTQRLARFYSGGAFHTAIGAL